MPFLVDAHRRRVPAQDIDRSIGIGVDMEAAMPTDKDRLAFAALSVNGSALRTGLRYVCGIDLAQVSAAIDADTRADIDGHDMRDLARAKLICQPSASRVTVAFFSVPRIGRVSRNFTKPTLSKRTADHLALSRFVSISRPCAAASDTAKAMPLRPSKDALAASCSSSPPDDSTIHGAI